MGHIIETNSLGKVKFFDADKGFGFVTRKTNGGLGLAQDFLYRVRQNLEMTVERPRARPIELG